MNYNYDGTISGLFCALARAIENNEQPYNILPAGRSNPSLFDDTKTIITDEQAAEKLLERLKKISDGTMIKNLFLIFLSESEGVEKKIFQYVRLALENRCDPAGQLQHLVVKACQSIWQKVQREVHRFEGFLRFEELDDGLLWGSFAPDFNIACLLAPYFAKRMSNEQFMICDVKRGIGFYYNTQEIREIVIDAAILNKLHQKSTLRDAPDPYAQLWRQYFDQIAIGQRRNPRLQMSLMPKKYWKYLTEKTGYTR